MHAEVYMHNDEESFRGTLEFTELEPALRERQHRCARGESHQIYQVLRQAARALRLRTFVHLELDIIGKVEAAKPLRLIGLMQTNASSSQFRTCVKRCDESLELNAEGIKKEPRYQDFVVDMRETAEIGFYYNEYLLADYKMDFSRALMWVGMMNEAYERMKHAPDI